MTLELIAERDIWKERAEKAEAELRRLQEGFELFADVLFDYDGYDPTNAEHMRGLVDEIHDLSVKIMRGEKISLSAEEFEAALKMQTTGATFDEITPSTDSALKGEDR